MELHGISRLANIAVSIGRQVKRLETSTHRQVLRFSSAQPQPLSTSMLDVPNFELLPQQVDLAMCNARSNLSLKIRFTEFFYKVSRRSQSNFATVHQIRLEFFEALTSSDVLILMSSIYHLISLDFC